MWLKGQYPDSFRSMIMFFWKGSFLLIKKLSLIFLGKNFILFSIFSPATCWESIESSHSFTEPLFHLCISLGKCRLMHILFVVSQPVLRSFLSVGQATDIFYIEVLLNWECELPEVSMLMSSWLKQAWRKQTCLSLLY